MKRSRCEYCGDVAVTRSIGDLLSCRLHADQPGTRPLYDSDTGLPTRDPAELREFLRKNRIRQMKAQAVGNAAIARALREQSAMEPTVGVEQAGHDAGEEQQGDGSFDGGGDGGTSRPDPQGGHQ